VIFWKKSNTNKIFKSNGAKEDEKQLHDSSAVQSRDKIVTNNSTLPLSIEDSNRESTTIHLDKMIVEKKEERYLGSQRSDAGGSNNITNIRSGRLSKSLLAPFIQAEKVEEERKDRHSIQEKNELNNSNSDSTSHPAALEIPASLLSPSLNDISIILSYKQYASKLPILINNTLLQDGFCTYEQSGVIEGRFSGSLFSSRDLVVSAAAIVEGDIEVDTLIVFGTLRGKITARKKAVFLDNCSFQGVLVAPCIYVSDTVNFEAECKMNLTLRKKLAEECLQSCESLL
jgi:cytoskeletal protein CcmA (bactofilin family)